MYQIKYTEFSPKKGTTNWLKNCVGKMGQVLNEKIHLTWRRDFYNHKIDFKYDITTLDYLKNKINNSNKLCMNVSTKYAYC